MAAIEALLRERGHAVQVLERSSQALAGPQGRARGGIAMLRGGPRPAEVRAAVEQVGADVVHVHNLNPLFGPRALEAARSAGARVVMHLHNYRLFCSIAIAYRDGGTCTRCHGRDTLPGVRLRCRGNLPGVAGLRGRAVGAAEASAGGGRPLRRAEPRRRGHARALRHAGRPHGRAAQLPAGRRVRAGQQRRRGRARAVRRPAGRGEGTRHGRRGGGALRGAAAGRRGGARGRSPAGAGGRRAVSGSAAA